MKSNAKCVEVRSADGNLMFRLHLYDEEPAGGDDMTAFCQPHLQRRPQKPQRKQPSRSGRHDRGPETVFVSYSGRPWLRGR